MTHPVRFVTNSARRQGGGQALLATGLLWFADLLLCYLVWSIAALTDVV